MAMSEQSGYSRRKVLTLASTGLVASLGGCGALPGVGDKTDGKVDEKPDPSIVSASADVGNFRQTKTRSDTLFVIKNEGGLAEFKVTVKARGDVAVYNQKTSEPFSLKKGQDHQMGFELFTHEGAEQIEIITKPTNYPNLSVTEIISEEETPDQINYNEEN